MDRIATPTGVITLPRPAAGLSDVVDDIEREDNDQGPEPEAAGHRLPGRYLFLITGPARFSGGWQCNDCGGWFDGTNGGTCSACLAKR